MTKEAESLSDLVSSIVDDATERHQAKAIEYWNCLRLIVNEWDDNPINVGKPEPYEICKARTLARLPKKIAAARPAPDAGLVEREAITRFVDMVQALLRHTNPCNVNEGHSQQWFAVSDECARILSTRTVAGEPVAKYSGPVSFDEADCNKPVDACEWPECECPKIHPAPSGRDPATIEACLAAVRKAGGGSLDHTYVEAIRALAAPAATVTEERGTS